MAKALVMGYAMVVTYLEWAIEKHPFISALLTAMLLDRVIW